MCNCYRLYLNVTKVSRIRLYNENLFELIFECLKVCLMLAQRGTETIPFQRDQHSSIEQYLNFALLFICRLLELNSILFNHGFRRSIFQWPFFNLYRLGSLIQIFYGLLFSMLVRDFLLSNLAAVYGTL